MLLIDMFYIHVCVTVCTEPECVSTFVSIIMSAYVYIILYIKFCIFTRHGLQYIRITTESDDSNNNGFQ